MTILPFQLLALDEDAVELADENDDVRGLVVLDANGHRIGEVDDMLVDEAHRRARMLVVASGGVLGLGGHLHLIPVEAVARVSDHVRLQLPRTWCRRPSETDARADPVDYAAVYRRYGCTPFWDQHDTGSSLHEGGW